MLGGSRSKLKAFKIEQIYPIQRWGQNSIFKNSTDTILDKLNKPQLQNFLNLSDENKTKRGVKPTSAVVKIKSIEAQTMIFRFKKVKCFDNKKEGEKQNLRKGTW